MDEDTDSEEEEMVYLTKIGHILAQSRNTSRDHYRHSGPASIIDGQLYLGDYSDANSFGLLTELGISHVLNCAGAGHVTGTGTHWCPFPPEVGIREYQELDAEDTARYQLCNHFESAFEFIDSALKTLQGNKVLVYCAKGVNRSAAICVAYLVHNGKTDLLSAVRTVADARGRILTNGNFQRQLINLARSVGLLR